MPIAVASPDLEMLSAFLGFISSCISLMIGAVDAEQCRAHHICFCVGRLLSKQKNHMQHFRQKGPSRDGPLFILREIDSENADSEMKNGFTILHEAVQKYIERSGQSIKSTSQIEL